MNQHRPPLGFASDATALAERRTLADQLVGQRLVRVEYVNIDYFGWDLGHRDQSVRRQITGPAEWRNPTWDAGAFHHLDFGIEFTTDLGQVWGITWDSAGPDGKSMALRPGRVSDAGAVWDVTQAEPWRSLSESAVSEVTLRYHPWGVESGGFWCTRASLSFDGPTVEVLLGDCDTLGSLSASADNIAVIVSPAGLPGWERTDDLV
ncbi:hypothetical protein SAMN05444157_0657 [Frankineae bacterium MT45]|nr:hypothetical protein SAMN05444157_0657 [Frankineae bacterium MT45]